MSAGPNLLFLFSDQHAQRVAGCYGDGIVATPNLDRLAGGGVTFDNAFTPSPVCVPARMAMLTGRHPHANVCWTNDDILSSAHPTWLHSLGAAGLRTALVGRMHSMGPDQLRGYAERAVGDHSPHWPGVPRHDLGVLARANDPFRESVVNSGKGQAAYQVVDEASCEAACEWIRRWAREGRAEAGEQFALTVGFILPHAPFVAPDSDFERYRGRVPAPAKDARADDHPWLAWWRENRGVAALTAADADRARTAYYALTARLDRLIGRVLAALEEAGLGGDTLVVYASDHGEQIGERGLWWKHTFYDESAKVPLVMSWPGRLPRGERRGQVVSLIDLAATMVEALGGVPLPSAHGRSFLDVARDGASPWLDLAFSEYCTDAVPDWTGGMAVQQRMIRLGRWKLVYYHGYEPQLFELRADPGETTDLAGSAAHRPVREGLLQMLLADWDPDAIAKAMARRRKDKDVLAAWGRETVPADFVRFTLGPEMNRLDG